MAVAGLGGGNVLTTELQCVRAGQDMIATAGSHPSEWQIRVGIYSGPVSGGLVGSRQFLFEIWWNTVNMSSRVQSVSPAQTLTRSKKTFDSLGQHTRG